jgi:hypothetical protein
VSYKLSFVLPATPTSEISMLLELLPDFFPGFEVIIPPTQDPLLIELARANGDTIRFVPGSLRDRIGAAQGRYLMFQRGIGTAELEKLAHYAGKADLVIGFSRQKQSTRFLSSLLYRTSLREVGGFMLCKTALLKELDLTAAETPLLLALEIAGKAERQGCRIIEIELATRPTPVESLTTDQIFNIQRLLRNYKPTQTKKPYTVVPQINLYMVSGAVGLGVVWLTRRLVRGKKK